MAPPLHRRGRVGTWTIISLLGLLAAVLIYRQLHWPRSVHDPILLKELEGVVLAAAPAGPQAGDWPQWRGPRRDGLSLETGLLVSWPAAGPKVLWQAKAGEGFSTFAVAACRVYTMLQDNDDEAVVCWNSEDGKERWRFRYPCRYFNDFGSGPRATPTIDRDFVYTVGATGLFHCLKADTGEQVWKHDLLTEFNAQNLQWGVSFSPLIEGDLIYTNPGGPNGQSLAAFDKRSGKLVWRALDDVAGYSSPMAFTLAGKRQILFFTGKRLVSVAPDSGQVYWSVPWETEYDCNVATPIAVGDYVFISSGYNRGCALLKVSAEGDKLSVRSVYENTRMRNHFSSCVYCQEHLYGFDDATLTCLEFRTGKVRWTERGFRKGSLTIADGRLIILGESGKLALADATPEGYRERASYRFSSNKCWSVPVLAGGRLYVRDEEKIACFDLKKP